MKESQLKKILTTPQMDASMEHRIADNLLFHDINTNNSNQEAERMRALCRFTQNSGSNFITKIGFAVFVLAIVGAATVWAAGLFVKSYPVDISYVTTEENNKQREEIIKEGGAVSIFDKDKMTVKHFGAGNAIGLLITDYDGRLLQPDENGNYVRKDGTIIEKSEAEAYKNMSRKERNKKNGDDAFAELGIPNLVPTAIYEQYYLDRDGFTYKEQTFSDDFIGKEITAHFITNNYGQIDKLQDVWFSFSPSSTSTKDAGVTSVRDDLGKDIITSNYTTKTGIQCTIEEYSYEGYSIGKDHLMKEEFTQLKKTVHIQFDSETIGNGFMMIEFTDTDLDTVKAILDTLPLSEEDVTQSDEN